MFYFYGQMFTDVDNTDVETKKANEGICSIN